jgi:hypothetical protein
LRNIFRIVNRRFIRPIVHLLAAAQLLLAVPLANAMPAGPSQAAQAHCADMAPAAGDSKPCPCCPGDAGMAACMSSCLATPCVAHSFILPSAQRTVNAPPAAVLTHVADRADPPLKPPPIY